MPRMNPFGPKLFDILTDLIRDLSVWLPGEFFPLNGIYGTDKPDTLFGSKGPDTIFGLGGDDELHGASGNDTIFGGDGNDYASGDSGNDRMFGGTGADAFYGEEGDDSLYGGQQGDELAGGAGRDQLYGEQGDDLVSGGEDDDRVFGGDGHDRVWGDDGNDLLSGGNGNDRLNGGLGNDVVYGGDGDDFIDDVDVPGDTHDSFYGGDGNDTLVVDNLGGALADAVLDGGAGFDRLEMAIVGETLSHIGLLAGVTENIEAIGLAFAGDSTLFVNPHDVFDFSDTHTLFVTGGWDIVFPPITCVVANDHADGNAWTATGTISAHGGTFFSYQSVVEGQLATLYVDSLLPQTGLTA